MAKGVPERIDALKPIDPLKAKGAHDTVAAQAAIRREIENILSSYVGWFDPFSELIQNALDSTDARAEAEGAKFQPQLRIIIDIKENTLTVSDNGTGLTKEQYEQFLAPSFSFKSGKTRGHKGVGATYLAYGFNSIQVTTKTKDFKYVAKMESARKWLTDPSPASNPLLVFDKSGCARRRPRLPGAVAVHGHRGLAAERVHRREGPSPRTDRPWRRTGGSTGRKEADRLKRSVGAFTGGGHGRRPRVLQRRQKSWTATRTTTCPASS